MMSRIDKAIEAAAVYIADHLITEWFIRGNSDVGRVAADREARKLLAILVRTLYGCKQCGGTGRLDTSYATGNDTWSYLCSAEHVTLTILGVEIQADRRLCEWRCYRDLTVNYTARCSPEKPHIKIGCGWVPRPITELEER